MDAIQLHYFAVLGLQPTSDLHNIKEAYMKKAKELHPDKTGSRASTPAMQGVQDAWKALLGRCPTACQIDDYHCKSKTHTEGQTEPKNAMAIKGASSPWGYMVRMTAISLLIAILFECLTEPKNATAIKGASSPWQYMVMTIAISLLVAILFECLDLLRSSCGCH